MIRIAVVEDQTLMRSALISLLDLEDDITVVGQSGRGEEVTQLVQDLGPDVLLLDIELPGQSGLEALEDLHLSGAHEETDTHIIFVTTFARAGYLRRAMDAGARGFLVKDDPVEKLAAAIRRVVAGETVIDPLLAAQALSAGENPLSDREVQVLIASDGGTPVADIASALHLSPSTVRNYLSNAIGKMRARNSAEALHSARHEGWV
ncbi:response regulator transcription factor [Brevibacterium sp. UCMA 11752]|uniref:response regulator transcription factor n=1 Tax=Brevibacterium sp. UCMA 11752 TaxID=2745946 RepID=UPI001F300C43|nr:response regulator transcription factor [Brevibacterium sp. UCMA 11752]MCF2587268.1 response regulator transcription factor [Brevibacterium sp. UCMA 11752]